MLRARRSAPALLAAALVACSSAGGGAGAGGDGSGATGGAAGTGGGSSGAGGSGGNGEASCAPECPDGWSCVRGACSGGDPSSLALDVRTVKVSGSVLQDGKRPEVSQDCSSWSAIVSFVDEAGVGAAQDTLECSDASFRFSVTLSPGTYRVVVTQFGGGSTLPDGVFVVERALAIDGPRSGLSLDVRTIAVSGKLLLDGRAPPVGAGCSGEMALVHLTERGTGTSVSASVPCRAPFAFTARVPEGTYVAQVQPRTEGAGIPDGIHVVDRELRLDATHATADLDVRPVAVSGNVLLNGKRPVAGAECVDDSVQVSLTSADGGWVSLLVPCSDPTFGFEVQVTPGTYAVQVTSRRSGASDLPDGWFTPLPALEVKGPVSGLKLDVRPVEVSGRILTGGSPAAPGMSCTDRLAQVELHEVTTGASAGMLVPCATGRYALQVAPGTYAVMVSTWPGSAAGLPGGTFVLDTSLRVGGALARDLDVRLVPVAGTLTVDGRDPDPPDSCSGTDAVLTFRSAGVRASWTEPATAVAAEIPCGARHLAWSASVPAGTYEVAARPYRTGESSLPDATLLAARRVVIR